MINMGGVLEGCKQKRQTFVNVGQGKITWGGNSGSTILGKPLMNA